MKKRVIIYGDIHGCLKELKKLREKLQVNRNDIEISVGDFLNKGSKSVKTLRYIEKNHIFSVIGNNEEKIIRYYYDYKKDPQKCAKNIRKYELKIVKKLNTRDIHFLKSLPYFIKIKNLTVVHGGVKIGLKLNHNLSEQDKKDITLIRFYNDKFEMVPYSDKKNLIHFWSDHYNGSEGFVVFGHHPFKKPKISKYAIGIDTGCVYGGKLTAVVFNFDKKKIDTRHYKIYQQKAKSDYFAKACQ